MGQTINNKTNIKTNIKHPKKKNKCNGSVVLFNIILIQQWWKKILLNRKYNLCATIIQQNFRKYNTKKTNSAIIIQQWWKKILLNRKSKLYNNTLDNNFTLNNTLYKIWFVINILYCSFYDVLRYYTRPGI